MGNPVRLLSPQAAGAASPHAAMPSRMTLRESGWRLSMAGSSGLYGDVRTRVWRSSGSEWRRSGGVRATARGRSRASRRNYVPDGLLASRARCIFAPTSDAVNPRRDVGRNGKNRLQIRSGGKCMKRTALSPLGSLRLRPTLGPRESCAATGSRCGRSRSGDKNPRYVKAERGRWVGSSPQHAEEVAVVVGPDDGAPTARERSVRPRRDERIPEERRVPRQQDPLRMLVDGGRHLRRMVVDEHGREAGVPTQPADQRREVQMPVGNVDREDAVRAEVAQVDAERLAG